jgi:hypothetical protein
VPELWTLGGITRLAMSHPYIEFEQTPLWKAIDAAIAELEQNQDVELRTTREHFIGYLYWFSVKRRLAQKANALLPRVSVLV